MFAGNDKREWYFLVKQSRLTSWNEILTLTQQISELANQEHWEELPELAIKRHQLIESFFTEPVSDDIAS